MSIDRLYIENNSKQIKGAETSQLAGEKRLANILGPVNCVFANKFIKTLNEKEDTTMVGVQAPQHVDQGEPPKTNIFKMGKELLYGGQGKFNSNSNLTLNN
jgi:hypothetical protein